jgi:hypothetical protein
MVIENFLPLPVASAALAALQCAPAAAWDFVEAKHDVGRKADGAGSTQHRYSCMGEIRVHGDGDKTASSASSSSSSESCSLGEVLPSSALTHLCDGGWDADLGVETSGSRC